MRYVHSSEWTEDVCPGAPPPMYPSNAGKHITEPSNYGDEHLTPDRLQYMACKNCDAAIWGHHQISEEPDLFD